MAGDRFEFALVGTAEEIAEYLTSLAADLRRGEVSLESGAGALRLTPAGAVKLELTVGTTARRGTVRLELGWKRQGGARAADLRLEVDTLAARP